jgi:DNA-binding MarR family transcriptional regulator
MKSRLQEEIHKKHPFEHPEDEAILNLLRTHSVLFSATERFLRNHDLSMATYNVLRILRAAGDEGRSCSGIGDDMVARVPDVTRLVDRLERLGMVTRGRGQQDRRVVRVVITQAGTNLLAKVDMPLIELYKSMFKHMSRGELDHLSVLLYKTRHPEEFGVVG